ncbi:MAG: hypothetical protein IPO21_11035 [Bacteroidales bacterium]|nr:hypothetical protein [Bacteroidales bacterium]
MGNAAGYANRGVYLSTYNPEFKRDIVPFNILLIKNIVQKHQIQVETKEGIGTDTQ